MKNMVQRDDSAGFLRLEPRAKAALAAAFIAVLIASGVLAQTYRVIQISGASMQPTLHEGDWAVLQIKGKEPRKGMVVGIRREASPAEGLVKRVSGVPGDRPSSLDGRVWTLQPGQYWVSSDYHWKGEQAMYDSSHFGPVERDEIKGVLIKSARMPDWLYIDPDR